MLPMRRWPMFLFKVLRTIVAPQRWAVRAELRAERLMEVCRRQHEAAKLLRLEREQLWQTTKAQHANEKRMEREAHAAEVAVWANKCAASNEDYVVVRRELADERERHAETRLALRVLEGEKPVLERQIELQEQIIQKYLEVEACAARNHAAKFQGRQPENDS